MYIYVCTLYVRVQCIDPVATNGRVSFHLMRNFVRDNLFYLKCRSACGNVYCALRKRNTTDALYHIILSVRWSYIYIYICCTSSFRKIVFEYGNFCVSHTQHPTHSSSSFLILISLFRWQNFKFKYLFSSKFRLQQPKRKYTIFFFRLRRNEIRRRPPASE